MSALDWFLSVVSMAGFVFFVGILAVSVPEPALLVVISVAVLLAAYDFWIRPFVKRR